jgi:hypothetical protein
MNRREACEWVHARLIVDEMPSDELVAAFTVLVGRVPKGPDRDGMFRRCYDIVGSLTGVSEELQFAAKTRARRPSSY